MKILIADDDRISRLILEKQLSSLECELVFAEDGEQAWEILQQPDPPRLLILDWIMPGLSGIDIVGKIRQRDDGHQYYIIIQTSLDKPGDVVFALNEGADDYITKPYNPDILRARANVGYRLANMYEKLAEKLRLLADANQRISQLASTDELTDLYNRRFFNQGLAEELSSAHRHQYPLSLIVIDIDRFKSVNDNYGHQMGDKIIKLFAQTLRQLTRTEDMPARWGGEEFILCLGHTSIKGAAILANRLRQQFSAACLQETGLTVTASFGVVELKPGENAEGLIKRADNALYHAKEDGRDRVIINYGNAEFQKVPEGG